MKLISKGYSKDEIEDKINYYFRSTYNSIIPTENENVFDIIGIYGMGNKHYTVILEDKIYKFYKIGE